MTINSVSSITNGMGAIQSAKMNGESAKFSELLNSLQSRNNTTLSSSQINNDGRLNGDYTTSFAGTYDKVVDKNATPQGAAANQANPNVQQKKIDKTSKLYEKAMELESFFVKQLLSSMRKTVNKVSIGNNDFASNMYEDMLYDEYATSMTKNAGFGLADQIYMQLS